MAYTDWPAIIADINQKYGTAFAPDETGPALKFLTSQYNGCASQAGTACGVSQNVMYRACKRYGIETLRKFGPKISWPDALIRINAILETSYIMDDFAQALQAIIDKEGGYKPAATAIGCGETAIRRRARQLNIYSPYYNGKRPSETILPPAVAVIDIEAWHKSGTTKSPCAMCPIGKGTKERTECFQCTARIEYANAQAGMPALPGADSMQQVQYMRQGRMSACS
ncbi:MAG: hypothetical protein PHW59_14005 [Desulfobacterales bacterium]|nr:hypothetical protein [Desulfobacterales bacterium]